MKMMLIGMAAAVAIVPPASAADFSGTMPQVHRHHGQPGPSHSRNQPVFVDGQSDLRHQHGDSFAGWYDHPVDVNRSWEADSYNDWWHDRPDRAYPRWMTHNENCDRIWWSGGGWRC